MQSKRLVSRKSTLFMWIPSSLLLVSAITSLSYHIVNFPESRQILSYIIIWWNSVINMLQQMPSLIKLHMKSFTGNNTQLIALESSS